MCRPLKRAPISREACNTRDLTVSRDRGAARASNPNASGKLSACRRRLAFLAYPDCQTAIQSARILQFAFANADRKLLFTVHQPSAT